MKIRRLRSIIICNIIILVSLNLAAQETGIYELKGKVIDSKTLQPLPYSNVCVKNKAIGTMANEEGEFIFRIPSSNDSLVISYIGYSYFEKKISELDTNVIVKLDPINIELDEIVIRPLNALDIVKESMAKISVNHFVSPLNMTAFYREMIQENGKFFEYAEGILDLYKESGESYRIKLVTGRRKKDIERFESMKKGVIKIGGPASCLSKDIISYKRQFKEEEYFKNYNYEIEEITSYKGKTVYVISFDMKESDKKAMYKGKFFIDVDSLALVKVDFTDSKLGLKKNQPGPVVNGIGKLVGMEVNPRNAYTTTSYEEVNGKWYLKNINYSFTLSLKKKKKDYLYEVTKNFLVLSVSTENIKKIPEDELLNSNDEFGQQIGEYDESFWGNYNYLLPTDSLKLLINKSGY